jgi:hypothetical protein
MRDELATARTEGDTMDAETATRPAERCPFLVPVMADRLWLRPTSAYCRRPGGRMRVPGASTIDCICETKAYLLCAGYLEASGRTARRVAMSA